MLDNLIYSLNGTVPIFAVMVLGYILKQRGMLSDSFVSCANKFVFRVSLPVMVFEDLWRTDIRSDFNWKFVLFCFAATAVSFAVIWAGAEVFFRDKTQIGAFVQGSFRSSAAVLGLAFITNLYSDAGMAPLMIIGAVPFYNVASVVVLTFRGRDQENVKGRAGIRKAMKGIVTNPIIIGIVLGCAASLVRLKLPVMVTKSLDLVRQTATPLALLAIGAGFTWSAAKAKKTPAIWGTAIKLVLQAVIVLPIAYILGFKNQEMLAVIIMIAGPATPSGYVMAREMNNDYELASSIVVLSTIFSAFTLTFWIYIMKSLGALN